MCVFVLGGLSQADGHTPALADRCFSLASATILHIVCLKLFIYLFIYFFCCCCSFFKIATNLQLGRIFSTARISFPVDVNRKVFLVFLNSRSAVIGGFVSLNCWVERLIQQLCFRVLLPLKPLKRRTE